ncbi:Dihydrolipoamide dehydrogenase [Desulfosporosinus sp. I2]|uniref:dihydrolipoyl dehydrogenase n=1 Tax=Desulfosporosinus sp. I2 TaxID=1617025 RepID=UPI0005EFB7D0|nr:dihydrolipoyl dehydrogenase [Desulfosporosinus sp. I2]KJR47488.1 Dihydrolipoamide dehydrogenase [Desulfosporosinus sp. I2]
MVNNEGQSSDICVLGGGPAGYVAAIRAAQLGAKVSLIEHREVGGTCLNRGCIPTKALLKTSEVLNLLSKSKEFGIAATVSSIDARVLQSRKDRVVKSLRMGVEHLLSKNGIDVLKGKGRIESSKRVIVNTEDGEVAVNCNRLIITTGSEPLIPNIQGIKLAGVLTSDEALELTEIPESITIIGAGAIGMEFATLYHSLGSKVTVIEVKDTIIPNEDKEITAELLKIMKRQGIKFQLGSKVKGISESPNGFETRVYVDGKEVSLITEKILVAVGRKLGGVSPDISALGVEVTKGSIVVNERMETNVPGVYAAGDVIGGSLLAHLAFAEGRVAAENALGIKSRLNYTAVPSCVYTNPEVAAVGLSEDQAKEKGIAVKVGRFDFRNNGRALCHGEREGFVKVITEEGTGVILGARILGPHASELITEITLAVSLGVKAEVLADMIHPHPALAEAVMEACGDAIGRAIHK